MLRIDPDNNCMIQKLDCDGNWITWLDITRCVQSSTFDLQVNLGGINFGSGQPATSECHDYDLIHESTGVTLIPVTMSTGDTIEFSAWKGAATDGFSVDDIFDITLIPAWYCPSGQGFALNECHDDPGPAETDDPFQDFNHMRAIFVINNVPYDAYNTVVTIPSGVVNQQGYVILNDHNLSDNSGTMQFHAKVCALGAVDTWTHTFDFLTSECGFTASSYDDTTWTAGQGFHGTSPVIGVEATRNMPIAAHIIYGKATYSSDSTDSGARDGSSQTAVIYFNGTQYARNNAAFGANYIAENNTGRDVPEGGVILLSAYTHNDATYNRLVQLVLQGTGTPPDWS